MTTRIFDRALVAALTALLVIGLVVFTPAGAALSARAQAAGPAVTTVESTLLPRFISLSVSGLYPFGAAACYSGCRYIELQPAGTSYVQGDFTLPPDYAAGTPVSLRFMTNSLGLNCFNVLQMHGTYEVLDASAGIGVQFPGSSTPQASPMWNAHGQQIRTFTVQVTDHPSYPFGPGASIGFILSRLGDNVNDTCTADLLISGVSVHYQGLTTYLPMTIR